MRSITKFMKPMTIPIPHNQTNAMTSRWQVVARLFVTLAGTIVAFMLLVGHSNGASPSMSMIAPDAFYTVSGVVSNRSNDQFSV